MKINLILKKNAQVLYGLIFTLLASEVYSLDCPHSDIGSCSANLIDCSDCHIAHNAPGMNLTSVKGNVQLCRSCHTTLGQAGSKPFDNDMAQSQPGINGNSHRWDALVKNSTIGTRVPVPQGSSNKDYMNLRLHKHKSSDDNTWRLNCSTCHDQHEQSDIPFDPNAPADITSPGRHFQRYINSTNEICRNCHWARDVQDVTSITPSNIDPSNSNYNSHPVRVNYSGITVRPAPLDSNGTPQSGSRFKDNGSGDTNWTNNFIVDTSNNINCMTCHWVHYTDSNSQTIDLR